MSNQQMRKFHHLEKEVKSNLKKSLHKLKLKVKQNNS
jgi:hypothetical protein